MAVILVSACLVGCPTRYLGDTRVNEAVLALGKKHTLIPVCPEQLGGLPTPRHPSEIQPDGRVVNDRGEDVTEQYNRGAETALEIYRISGAQYALLKANSPSCGRDFVYDGTFSSKLRPGRGVTAELFGKAGIEVYSEKQLDEFIHKIEKV